MSDAVKVTALCCSIVGFVVCLLLEQQEFTYTFVSIFGAILGLPIVTKGIQKLVK